jgi:hypothetical protein
MILIGLDWLYCSYFHCSTGLSDKRVPEIDIVFAVNAYAAAAEADFRHMKSVMESIIDKYAMGKMRYGVIVYGTNPRVKVNFNEEFPTDDDLNRYLLMVSL